MATSESEEWIFLATNLGLEMFSAACDQASSPRRPHFALCGMLLAIAAVLISIGELIYKGKKEGVVFRSWGMLGWFYHPPSLYKPFGTLPDIFGLVAGISQCICSMVQYVYCLQHADNPFKVSLLPAIFLVCLGASKLINNRMNAKDSRENSSSTVETSWHTIASFDDQEEVEGNIEQQRQQGLQQELQQRQQELQELKQELQELQQELKQQELQQELKQQELQQGQGQQQERQGQQQELRQGQQKGLLQELQKGKQLALELQQLLQEGQQQGRQQQHQGQQKGRQELLQELLLLHEQLLNKLQEGRQHGLQQEGLQQGLQGQQWRLQLQQLLQEGRQQEGLQGQQRRLQLLQPVTRMQEPQRQLRQQRRQQRRQQPHPQQLRQRRVMKMD